MPFRKKNGWLGNGWLHGLKYKRAMYREMVFSAPYTHNMFLTTYSNRACCQ